MSIRIGFVSGALASLAVVSIVWSQTGGESPCYVTSTHPNFCAMLGNQVSAPGAAGACDTLTLVGGGAIKNCDGSTVGQDDQAVVPNVTSCQKCDLILDPVTGLCTKLGSCSPKHETTHECVASGNPCGTGAGGD